MEDRSLTFEFAMQAGELMRQNSAETHRVEDTIKRILESSDFDSADVFVIASGIFVSAHVKDKNPITLIRKVEIKEIDLKKIIVINSISRNFVEKKISVEKALEELEEVRHIKPYNYTVRVISSGIACFAFSSMLGSTYFDALNSFLTGMLVFVIDNFLVTKLHIKYIIVTNLIGGLFIGICTLTLLNLGLGQNIDKIITGALMPLLPGVIFTSAVRDVFEGDLMSGFTRMFDAITIAIALACGVGILLKIWLFTFGGFII